MGKENDSPTSVSKEERKALKKEKKERKEKKDKKERTKRSELDGVHKSNDKEDKKKRKKERAVLAEKVASAVEDGTIVVEEKSAVESAVTKTQGSENQERKQAHKKFSKNGTAKVTARPVGALVPFANPLADEKVAGKVFKGVKKAAATKSLKRGVKEVVKALRKSPNTTVVFPPPGVVVLAADVSPMDVISHIPVLCEDHGVPYIYVTSRAELGMAGQTKRPTSVVMLTANAGGKPKKEGDKEKEKEGAVDWKDTYESFAKVVEREGKHVRI